MGIEVTLKKKTKGFTLDLSFELQGKDMGILGASGSGKSMTLKCIAGVLEPDEGRIVVNGRVLYDSNMGINLKPQDRNIGFVFQNYALFPHMTVKENIGIGIQLSDKKKKESRIEDVLDAFKITELSNKYPGQISGGQQQRVALARALVRHPDILMLDEPFSALDVHLRDQMQTEVMTYLKSYDGQILLVSHNRDEIYRMCHETLIVDNGKALLKGETKAVFKTPRFKNAAKLTGCKNFSGITQKTKTSLLAEDWGIELHLPKDLIESNITTVGIRAHDFVLLPPNQDQINTENAFAFKILNTIEDVFEYTHQVEGVSQKTKTPLLFKVEKTKWNAWPHKDDLWLSLPADALLLLE